MEPGLDRTSKAHATYQCLDVAGVAQLGRQTGDGSTTTRSATFARDRCYGWHGRGELESARQVGASQPGVLDMGVQPRPIFKGRGEAHISQPAFASIRFREEATLRCTQAFHGGGTRIRVGRDANSGNLGKMVGAFPIWTKVGIGIKEDKVTLFARVPSY